MTRILAVSTGLAGLLIFLLLTGTAAAGLAVKEMQLNAYGSAYNVHADAQGNLWINDMVARELRRLDAAGGGYKVYTLAGMPMDTGPDASGGVWWLAGKTLNHLAGGSATNQNWDLSAVLPSKSSLWGLALESSGKVWLTDSGASSVYRFDPGAGQLCSYALPPNATGSYPAVSGANIWLGDNGTGLLIRIDASQNTLTWWQLPGTGVIHSSPEDVALDPSGNVWYTDSASGQIGQLDPVHGLRVYPLPAGHQPFQLAFSGQKIWYTEQSLPSLGTLDPASASYTTPAVTTGSSAVTPSCSTFPSPPALAVATSTGASTWLDNTYTTLVDANGWAVYQLPEGAYPWGIAVTKNVWMVDNFRKALVRYPIQVKYNIFIPAVRR